MKNLTPLLLIKSKLQLLSCFILIFPSGLQADVWNVVDYGAKGDAVTLNTNAIQRTIDRCASAGGGIVLIEEGVFVSGTLILKDNVTLKIAEKATLLGSMNPLDYHVIDSFVDATSQQRGSCLIGAVDATNIAVTGEGTIDGRGESFLQYNIVQLRKTLDVDKELWERAVRNRPFLLRFVRCKNVRLTDITLRQPAAWTCHLYQCMNVDIESITIYSHAHRNNDGIDIDSSSNIRINGCYIDSGDDAVCVKATSPLPVEHVSVTNCILKSNWGAIKLGTESMGDFRDITFDSCRIFHTKGGGIKILSVDGSNISRVCISNISMVNVDMPVFVRLGERLRTYRDAEKRPVGSISELRLYNIKAVITSSVDGRVEPGSAILLTGTPEHKISEITLENLDIEVPGGGTSDMAVNAMPENEKMYPEYVSFGITPAYGITARHIENLTLKNVVVRSRIPDSRPERKLIDVEKVTY